jgi:hypothetical protein
MKEEEQQEREYLSAFFSLKALVKSPYVIVAANLEGVVRRVVKIALSDSGTGNRFDLHGPDGYYGSASSSTIFSVQMSKRPNKEKG